VSATDSSATNEYRKREESVTLATESAGEGERHELLTLNIGPHHPATHGVLRLLATLEGEVIRDLKPIIGYLHTGIEKTCETKAVLEGHPGHRADGLPVVLLQLVRVLRERSRRCSTSRSARRPSTCASSTRAQPDHEPSRLARDEARWTSRDLDVLVTASASARRSSTSSSTAPARAHTRYFQVGGVIEDIPRLRREGRGVLRADGPPARTSTPTCWRRTRSSSSAMRDVCPLDEETLLGLGVTGPLLRAAGNPWDLRKAAPYCLLRRVDFKIPSARSATTTHRYRAATPRSTSR